MAGSGRFKSQDALKNKAMLVVRNITKQEVTNVIFPNGITIGADGPKFRNGLRIHGNAQVSGIVNAQGFKVNGTDLSVSGQPFLFLDVDSHSAAFDNSSDSSPTPSLINITITQQSQTNTLRIGSIEAKDVSNNNITVSSFNATETSTGNSTATAVVDISSLGRSAFPIRITAQNDGLTSTKTIVSVVGGDDGSPGTSPKSVDLSASSTLISYDAAGANPSPSSITLTANSKNFTNGFFKFTGGGAAFTDEGSYTDGTSANQDTVTFTAPSSYSSTPYSFTVGVAEGNQSELTNDTVSIGSFKPGPEEQLRTEFFSIDLRGVLNANLTSANAGHYTPTNSGRSSGNPAPVGKLSDTISMGRDVGSFPASTAANPILTGLSSATFCQQFSYRVPTGSKLSLKRVLGFLQFDSIPSNDRYFIELYVYESDSNDNGITSQKLIQKAQISIDGSNTFRIAGSAQQNPTDSIPKVIDTGSLSGVTFDSGKGIVFVMLIPVITTMTSGISVAEGTLSMEYTLS